MLSLKSFVILAIVPFALLSNIALAEDAQAAAAALIDVKEGENTKIDAPKNVAAKSPAEFIFNKMDTNHDSSLSLNEFEANFSILGSSTNSRGGSSDGNSGFWKGFSTSTMMIIATEIGDKALLTNETTNSTNHQNDSTNVHVAFQHSIHWCSLHQRRFVKTSKAQTFSSSFRLRGNANDRQQEKKVRM